MKYYSSQRIRITKVFGVKGEIKIVNEEGRQDLIGHWANVRITKNRCAPPYFDAIEVPIYYKEYFPDEAERLFEAARSLQVIKSRNNVVTWKNDSETVFMIEGTSSALYEIREKNLQSRLAHECVLAESSDKNQKKKNPYKLPKSLENLAKEYKDTIIDDKSQI